jgi:hypothetical protein
VALSFVSWIDTSELLSTRIHVEAQDSTFTGDSGNAFLPFFMVAATPFATTVNITLTRLSIVCAATASFDSNACTLHPAVCATLVSVASSSSATVSLVLDDARLIGPLLLLGEHRHASSGNGLSSVVVHRVDVFCSAWGRHSFSPLGIMGPDSGPTAMKPTIPSYINHLFHNQTVECLVPRRNPSGSFSVAVTSHVAPTLSISIGDIPTNSTEATATPSAIPPPRAPDSLTEQFFSSVGAVTAASGVSSAVSSAVGTALVRSAFTAQLATCAEGSVDEILSGDNGENNFFGLQVGKEDTRGRGYRSSLVGLLLVVFATLLFGAMAAILLQYGHRRRRTIQSVAAAAALPGWWLAGPCAAAVGPLFSSAISLASVSLWTHLAATDVMIVVASLGTAVASSCWSIRALLTPNHGGLFVCKTVGSAPTPLQMPSAVTWLLDGGHLWAFDPSSQSPLTPSIAVFVDDTPGWVYPHAYGSLFTSMRPRYYWHFLLDMAANIVVGIIAAVPAMVAARTTDIVDDTSVSNACIGALHATTAVQLLFAVYFVVARPVAVHWELIAGACMAILGALNALLASIQATSLASDVIDGIGNMVESLQLAASGLAVLCGVAECLLTLFVLKQRRSLLVDDITDDEYDASVSTVFAAPSTVVSLSSLLPPLPNSTTIVDSGLCSPLYFSHVHPNQDPSLTAFHHQERPLPPSPVVIEALSVLVQQAAASAQCSKQAKHHGFWSRVLQLLRKYL